MKAMFGWPVTRRKGAGPGRTRIQKMVAALLIVLCMLLNAALAEAIPPVEGEIVELTEEKLLIQEDAGAVDPDAIESDPEAIEIDPDVIDAEADAHKTRV